MERIESRVESPHETRPREGPAGVDESSPAPAGMAARSPRGGDARRRALARSIVRLLRAAIVDSDAVDLVFDEGRPGAPAALR